MNENAMAKVKKKWHAFKRYFSVAICMESSYYGKPFGTCKFDDVSIEMNRQNTTSKTT